MKLSLNGWKKIQEHKDHTILRNDDKGHELKILHAKLHPAQRGQLAALPMADGSPAKPAMAAKPDAYKAKLAQGGEVKGPRTFGGPSQLQGKPLQAARQKAAPGSMPTLDDRISKNNKALDVSGEAQTPQGQQTALSGAMYAKGGDVQVEPVEEPMGEIDLNAQPAPDAEAPVDPNAPSVPVNTDMSAPLPEALMRPDSIPQAAERPGMPHNMNIQEQAAARPENLPYGVTPDSMQAPSPVSRADIPAQPQAAAPQATAPADTTPDLTKGYQSALGQAQQGMNMEAKALTDQGNANAKLLHDQQAISQAAQADYAQHYQQLDQERNALMEDIKSGHIDPNHFVDSMTSGNRIATAIGMIASGLGAGMSGQENLAAKFFQQQIENDINAQKANLGAKETLLSANMRQFGNMKDAMDMTRLMRSDMISQQLQEAAAKAQGPIAQARLMQEAAKLKLQYAPLQQKIALNKTIATMTTAAQQDPSKAQAMVNEVSIYDPEKGKELRDRLVPGLGFANTPKQQEELNKTMSDAKVVKQGIARLLEISNTPDKSLSPALRAEASTTAKLLMGSMKDSIGFRTLTDGDQKFLEQIIANPTAVFSMDSSIKARLMTTRKYTDQAVAERAKQAGLHYDPAKQLPPEQQKMAEWARRNPHDPRSQAVLNKLGL